MGAYSFMTSYLEWVLEQIGAKNKQPIYAGRAASAATATVRCRSTLKQLNCAARRGVALAARLGGSSRRRSAERGE